MAVLILGGAGLIGLHCAAALVRQGKRVVCFDVIGRPSNSEEIIGYDAQNPLFVQGDILDLAQLEGAIEQYRISGVIHSAAIVNERMARKQPLEAVRANTLGTGNVLEVARRCALQRVLYTSSSTVYGRREDGRVISEDEVAPEGVYGETKYLGERLVRLYRRTYGLNTVVVRVSSAYGPGKVWHPERTNSPIYRLAWEASRGTRHTVTAGSYHRDFTYVSDTAAGICLAFQAPQLRSCVYNISGGVSYSLSQVAQTLNRIVKQELLHLDQRSDQTQDEALRQTLRGPLDITRARTELGYQPQYDLERGLRKYLDYLSSSARIGKGE